MGKHTLNSWRKPEEVKEKFIVLGENIYPFRKTHIFIGKIIPTTVIKDSNAFEITYLDKSMFIEGFAITTYTKEDNIMCINVFGEHPNCDMNTNEYCIPEHKKGMKLDGSTISLILTNLKNYYLDSAHFIPDKKLLQYKKVKSINIRFQQGEE